MLRYSRGIIVDFLVMNTYYFFTVVLYFIIMMLVDIVDRAFLMVIPLTGNYFI